MFSKCLLNFGEERCILLGNNWEKENNAILVLAVGKTLKQIKKFKLNLSFIAPQELIKCLPSFDIVLCLLTLLTKEVPGTGLHLAAAQWVTLLALLGPPWVSVRLTVAWPLLISTVLMGKECFKSQPKHVSLGTCDKQSFPLLLKRGKACTVPVQSRQHLQALPCLLPHLICGQGNNSARPFSFSAAQLNASFLVAIYSLQPWAKPCWNPRETCCWSHGCPQLGLKQPHPPKNTFPSTMRIPCLRFVFFFWSHLFPITELVITLPQTLSLPLTSMPCLIPPETLSAGMMSSWAPCITADAVGLTNERVSVSPAGSALLGNWRERLTSSEIAGAGGSWSSFLLWLWALGDAGKGPICFTAQGLPRASDYLADPSAAQHTVTQAAGVFAKGFSAFYWVVCWGLFAPLDAPLG